MFEFDFSLIIKLEKFKEKLKGQYAGTKINIKRT